MTPALRTVLPVWAAALIGAILVGLLITPAEYLGWIPIVMAACIILTFIAQLIFVQKEGFVTRIMVSIGGAIAILAAASLVLGLVAIA